MTKLFSCGALKVLISGGIFNNLALRVPLIGKEIGEWNPWRGRLMLTQNLFVLLVTLSFLLFVFQGQREVYIQLKLAHSA